MVRVLAVAVVASLLAGVSPAAAQGPAGGRGRFGGFGGGTEATGTAAITGRVVTADTGSPIRRAQVRAVATNFQATRIASTDADGRFELRDLPAGRWQLTVSKAGFVSLRYGQLRPFEAGRPIELRDNEVMDRAHMSLPRGAAITGRIFDEFGDPIASARVQVLRYQLVQGVRRLSPTGVRDQSDDTGAFRLYGLMPGDYLVSATLRALQVDDDPTGEAAGYAPTYYPGTGNVAEAQLLALGLGQELTGVSFSLLPVRTVRISGTVIDSTGGLLSSGLISLLPSDTRSASLGVGGTRGNVRRNGAFSLSNVAPGSYTLLVSPRGRGGAVNEVAMMPLTVGSEDILDLYVSTTNGATLSGSVTAAAGSMSALPTGSLQITTSSFIPGLAGRPTRVDDDGTFTLTGLFGSRLVRVAGLASQWMVQSIVLGGIDVTDEPIEFRPNEDVEGLRITLTDRVTEIIGKVGTSRGEPSFDYTVVVFPENETRWGPPSRYVQSARPDQDGQFTIRALPADESYLAVAVNYLENGEAADPRFLEQMRGRAEQFSLGEGETRALDLDLIER